LKGFWFEKKLAELIPKASFSVSVSPQTGGAIKKVRQEEWSACIRKIFRLLLRFVQHEYFQI